ncbi:universal stress protein [Apibacter muscae]|uniref:Universal stress protein n=1 Tax=Apibacter muscae TaxID=2509004 RepID=A0A563D939_9FLAO|nr:universal stress protein [Apibacter muscae]TWP26716.1 universal stress protein [Apibacter muscae]TWP27653.1 universal stress protein [Apibacter muscae]
MNTILVPIDFSNLTDHLLNEAIDYAKDTRSKVYLLHVASLDLGFVIGDLGFQYLPELEDAGMKEEISELKKYESKLKAESIDVEIIIKQGIPSEIILQEAEKLNVRMIVMGSHGKGFFMDVLLGSVSNEIIKKSKIPVLIIPSKILNK